MHGYIPTDSEDYGTLIVINPKQNYSKLSKPFKLVDVNLILNKEIDNHIKNNYDK